KVPRTRHFGPLPRVIPAGSIRTRPLVTVTRVLLMVGGGGVFLIRRAQRSLAFGDGQKRWIKLDKGVINRAMSGVAGITVGGSRDHFAGFRIVESEERPLAGKSSFVFYVHFTPHDFGTLIVAFLIDGAFVHRTTHFENENGLIGPRATFEEFLVSLRVHENVVKHVMAHRHGAWGVAHVESG